MSQLQDFLLENIVDDLTEEVVVSPRLKDRPFTIRAMSGTEFAEYTQLATKLSKGRKMNFNQQAFSEAVVINHTTDPNFKDADWLKKSGFATPGLLLNKVLLAGEIAELTTKISALSGFDKDMDDLVNDAKNS